MEEKIFIHAKLKNIYSSTQKYSRWQFLVCRAGEAGKSFRELALGFHPLLAVPKENPWIPYYGYGDGVVRLSLGDNSELGGNVTGGYVRWNFFTDTTVTVAGEVWVRDGKLVK